MKTTKVRLYLLTLFLSLAIAPSGQCAGEKEFLKVSDLHYADWITTAPAVLLPEFEQGCKAVAVYLHSQQLEFKEDDCVSNIFTTTSFIARANEFVENDLTDNPKGAELIKQVRSQYGRVVSDVIDKAISDGKAISQKENANLIYTVIVTIGKDVLTHYYHTVFANPNEAKVLMRLAEEENGKRLRREGEYLEIYQRLAGK